MCQQAFDQSRTRNLICDCNALSLRQAADGDAWHGAETPAKDLISHPQDAYSKVVMKLDAVMHHVEHHTAPMFGWEADEMKSLSQVAKRSVMACRLLQATVEKGSHSSFEAMWEFNHHWHFPTLSLKRRAER